MSKENKPHSQAPIDPKDLMAVERSATGLIGLSISLIVLGFIVEKFQLFLLLMSDESRSKIVKVIPQLQNISFYSYLGIIVTIAGVLLAGYTYFYYKKWIELLKRGEYDTDKKIYRNLSFFVVIIGLILILSMLVFNK